MRWRKTRRNWFLSRAIMKVACKRDEKEKEVREEIEQSRRADNLKQ